MSKEIISLSATELAQQIRSKKISVEQTIRTFLSHIEAVDPKINAISDLRPKEELIQEAKEKDVLLSTEKQVGPLFGVPITIKESIMVKGLQLTNGDPLLKNNKAHKDSPLVSRLKEAGAIIIGVTNIAIFSIDWQSTNSWNGTTNNPFDLTCTAGGSSGGSSATVAANMSPISIGSDAGGSVRVPAHFCGIYGFRPTEFLLSNRGHLEAPKKPRGRRHMITPGPFANSVEDLILTMEVLTNNANQSISETPRVDFKQHQWDKSPLNIAFSESFNGVEIDQEYLQLFQQFIKVLDHSEHTLQSDFPVYDEATSYVEYNKIVGFENGINSPRFPFKNVFMYLFIRLKYKDHLWAKGMAKGQYLSNVNYAKAMDVKDHVSDIYDNFLTKYDVWITPVCAIEAFKHQKAGKPFIINGKNVPYTKAIASYTFTTAFPGHPIAVIPIGVKKNGMPVGIQIHGRKWTDRKLLDIANHFSKLIDQISLPFS